MKQDNFHKKKRLVLLLVCLVTSLCLSSPHCFAQDRKIEYKIKAGYLYNFTKFIAWPEDTSKTFNLCIVGKDPFGSIINPIEKRSVKDKLIRLHRFRSVKKAKNCHIIYFSKPSVKLHKLHKLMPGVLTINTLKPTLTLGESKQFTQAGGMISFFIHAGKIKLAINLPELEKSGLNISAKLLEVAEVYEGESNE